MLCRFFPLVIVIALAACQQVEDKIGTSKGRSPTRNLVQTAQLAGNFRTLLKALNEAELTAMLEEKGPYTLFAPTDQAFAKMPAEQLADLLHPDNREKLKNLLLYHLVDGSLTTDDLKKIDSVRAVQGQQLSIHVKDDRIYVDEAVIEGSDINATNGVIHVIDRVLSPV